MNVTKKLKMDLTQPDPSLNVNAVQGDAYSRSLHIALFNGHHPWIVPENITIAVRYTKPDHTKGYYDTLPDGSSAWSVQNHILTIQLAPQMLTVAGNVRVQIEMTQDMHILSTFSLNIYVEANPAVGILQSENYTNWLQWLRTQSNEQVLLAQQSAQAADQAAANAYHTASNASAHAESAQKSANQAITAASSAAAILEETESIAEKISAIAARGEYYTKEESDHRYSPVITATASGFCLELPDSRNQELQGLRLFGKTTQSGTPSPANPITLENAGSAGTLTVSILSRNLFYIPVGTTMTQRGVTQTVQADGSILINGTKTESNEANLYNNGISAIPYAGKTITLRSETPNIRLQINVVLKDGTRKYLNASNCVKSVVIPENAATIGWQVSVDGISSYDNVVVYPYAVFGTEVGIWEPYTCQVLTVPTPKGLSGIPVRSGGNYTDEYGQQWICDELDFNRGVYIQRVYRLPLTADLFHHIEVGLHSPYVRGYQFRIVSSRPTLTFNPSTSIAGASGTGQQGSAMMSTFSNTIGSSADGACVMWENGTPGQYQSNIAFHTDYVAEATKDAFIEFFTAHPGEVLIGMHEPVETALSAETLAACAALHTNNPGTTICNDSCTGMEVLYVADTKRYVDKKFDALTAALASIL